MAEVTCVLPEESKYWRPDPFPGSLFARGLGCTCPNTQPWPGELTFDTDCPLEAHQLEGSAFEA